MPEHHSRVDLLNVRRGIAFSPSSPPLPHGVLLFLLSGTTIKLLYSYAFFAHTALSDAWKVSQCQEDPVSSREIQL